MDDLIHTAIGIQARSTSVRLPRKVFELIDGTPMLTHVINSVKKTVYYLNGYENKKRTMVSWALLIPVGDDIRLHFSGPDTKILEGPEYDVLTRYWMLGEATNADFICRITSDCPMIPPYLIQKHIKLAVMNSYDYVSNVDETVRTTLDGFDCEVMSRRMLLWAHENAKDKEEREHVTLAIRRHPPVWAKVGHVVGHVDLSGMKISVDTFEDLERVRVQYDSIKKKILEIERVHGKHHSHRF